MNKLIISGNVCSDLSLQSFDSGNVSCVIRVAVRRPYNTTEQTTDFFNCRAYGKMAERCVEKLEKGRKVIISGEMRLDRFKDAEGNSKTVPTVIVDTCEFVYPQNPEDNNVDTLREKKPALEEVKTDEELPF